MSNPIDNGPRIQGGNVNGPNRGQASKPGDAGTAPGQVSAADAATESERLQQVREQIDSAPEVDMERVEAIKLAIAEGRFPVDPQRIAAKFAELEGLLNA